MNAETETRNARHASFHASDGSHEDAGAPDRRQARETPDRGATMDEAVALEERLFGSCFETADQIEGMAAFLEKRKEKNFTNR